MDKLGGYNTATEQKVLTVARLAVTELRPSKVISGMALGWDQALALAALEANIPLIAAVPFKGQERMWPRSSQEVFNNILACAEQIVYVDEVHGYKIPGIREGVYHPAKMQVRNNWMVKHSDLMAVLWDGSKGGTGNCMLTVDQMRRTFRNFWPEFKALK